MRTYVCEPSRERGADWRPLARLLGVSPAELARRAREMARGDFIAWAEGIHAA